MFFLLVLILCLGMGSIANSIIFGVCICLGVLGHELGHAFVAQHFRLNPEILLHGFGGLTRHEPPATAKQDFLITFAGPIVGVVIGGLLLGLKHLLGMTSALATIANFPYLYTFLEYFMYVNLVWGIFNLIPIRPMDGSKVLSYVLLKFCRFERAEKISVIISLLFAIGILVLSLLAKNIFMVLLGGYFVFVNLSTAKTTFASVSATARRKEKQAIMRADIIYEKGLLAARDHNWKALEMYGHQMKKAASESAQLEKAYEFLTIACTNQGKYDEALEYSEHARQSDAVKQAVARCRSLTEKRLH